MWSLTERLKTALAIPESDILRIAPGVVAVNPAREAAIDAYIATRSDYTAYRWWWRRGYRCRRISVADNQVVTVIYDPEASAAVGQSDRASIILGSANTERRLVTTANVGGSLSGTALRSSLLWMAVKLYFAQDSATKAWTSGPFAQPEERPVYGLSTKAFGYEIGETFTASYSDWNIVGYQGSPMGQYGHSAGLAIANYPLVKKALPAPTNVGWRLIEGPAFVSHGEFFNGIGFVAANAAHISKWARQSGGLTFPEVQANLNDFADGVVTSTDTTYVWCSVPGGTNPYFMLPDCKQYANDLLAMSGKQGDIDLGLVRSNMANGGEFTAAVATYREQTTLSGSLAIVLDSGTGINITVTDADGVAGAGKLYELDQAKWLASQYISSGRSVVVDKSGMKSNVSIESDIAEQVLEFYIWYSAASPNARVTRSSSDVYYSEVCGGALLASASNLISRKDRTAISILLRPGMISDRVAQRVLLSVANQ